MKVWAVSDVNSEFGECDVFARKRDAIEFIQVVYQDTSEFIFQRFEVPINAESMLQVLSGVG